MGCSGNLTPEERRQLREGYESHKVFQIPEDEIIQEGYDLGRELLKRLKLEQGATLDTLAGAKGFFLTQAAMGNSVEQEIFQAYQAAPAGSQLENLQKMYTQGETYDSLIYTMSKADSTGKFAGMWSIHLAKANLVSRIVARR